jgi:LysR family nitrogen assimilation transcriptional regulator
MDIRQIRYFSEVALARSFKGAASRLNISQSSLSRRVADLERSLKTPLLLRHPRGVSLTRDGELFLERSGSVLRELDAMQAEVSGQTMPPASVVTVGSSPTVSRVLLAPLAAAFRGPPERIRLRFVEEAQYVLLEGLDAGRIDVALMSTPEPVANCRMEVLLEEQLYLVTKRKERPRRKVLSIANLDQIPMIMFPRPSTNRNLIERKARSGGVVLNSVYESSSAVVQLEFASLGLAACILPHFAITDHLSTRALAATPIKGLTISQTLVWRSDRRQPAIVAEVAEMIRAIMQRHKAITPRLIGASRKSRSA